MGHEMGEERKGWEKTAAVEVVGGCSRGRRRHHDACDGPQSSPDVLGRTGEWVSQHSNFSNLESRISNLEF